MLWMVAASHGAELAWHDLPGGRWAQAIVPTEGRTGFTLMPPETSGVTFTNSLAERTSALNRILENGSGVALGDVDGDGWCDLYFGRLEGGNALYRNLGNWRFAEMPHAAGAECSGQYSTGTAFADLDGDGDLDLLVNGIGAGTRSFLNDGKGRFTEIAETRLVRRFGATSLALADIDGDGDLDLYVANYRTDTFKDRPPGLNVEARMVDGRIEVTPEGRFIPVMPRSGGVEVIEVGDRDFLYVNDGRGRFGPVSWTAGAFRDEHGQPLPSPPADWGLAAMFRDWDGDGPPDLYVCNDFFHFPDRVWRNEEGRGFRALPRLALRHQSVSSMGVDFADLDRDGFDDFFVGDMVSRSHAWRQRQRPDLMQGILSQAVTDPAFRPEVAHNTLALNRGDHTYAEIAQLSGVDCTEWSWGAVFLDVDLDGWEDLVIPTGNNHDVQDADVLRDQARERRVENADARLARWRQFPILATPILAYRNHRDLTFTERGPDWGFTAVGPWQGMALGDLDNDGDLDVVVNRLNDSAGLYRNDSTAPRLAVRLKGNPPNTSGVTARIRVLGGPVAQTQQIICGGRYLSGDAMMRVFAAGSATNRLTIEVTWRTRAVTVVSNAAPNRIYELAETAGRVLPAAAAAAPAPAWFADLSRALDHQHTNTPFDDFARQPLLSRSLSAQGPGISWFDLDQDGRDDLIIGAGRGGAVAFFRNLGAARFERWTPASNVTTRRTETTTVLGYRTATDPPRVLTGLAHYEGVSGTSGAVEVTGFGRASTNPVALGASGSVGPLALADVDGDGDLDLFVGGRVVPGRYPEAAGSRLYYAESRPGEAPKFDPADQASLALLQPVGMVSGARFTDLTGDGYPELVLACEWGPIALFRNDRGRLSRWDLPLVWSQPGPGGDRPGAPLPPQPPTLSQLTGWWNGVAAGDFDGDGRLDLVGANWGRNTRFQRFLARPLRLHYGDLGGGGGVDLMETVFDPQSKQWVPWRDYLTVTKALPFLAVAVPTFKAFGETSAEQMLGDKWRGAQVREAVTLDSIVLLNRGDHLLVRPLPIQAQFAPAFGVAAADLDGDGRDDLVLGQNFFGVEPETSRYDAGVGLCLKGDGQGGFAALGPNESGVRAYGEQRGCALSDFDGDGRTDLALTQVNGPTQLYRNQTAKPGLRVRVRGPAGNPDGVGAVLQVKSGGQLGPAREISAGSGYWSQDSPVAVMATPEGAAQLIVRWPGGRITTHDVPPGARECSVRIND